MATRTERRVHPDHTVLDDDHHPTPGHHAPTELGEFIIIGDQSNGDLLKAAGFYKPGATFDFAVPLGDPDYGPHAFTFYKHPDPEWNDTREGTAVRYEDVLWRVKNKVNAAMMTTVAPAAFAIGPQPNKVFPIG